MVLIVCMKKIFPIELEEGLHRQLKHAAIDAGMSLHALIIRTLEENVNHKGPLSKKKVRNRDAEPDSH